MPRCEPILQPMLPEDEADPNWSIPVDKTEQQITAFDRIVTAIHEFVMFLQHLCVPEEAVHVPPKEGWHEITKESWASFGKSDEVIEVLRHLTYIEHKGTGEPYEFLPSSGLCDFRDKNRVRAVRRGDGRELAFMTEMPEEPVASHVVGLVSGGRTTPIIFLDCREGLVYGEGSMEFGWVEGEKRSVEEYFATIKERYRKMDFLPCRYMTVCGESDEPKYILKGLRKIFERHGWPDNYNRDACVAEITELGTPGDVHKLEGYE